MGDPVKTQVENGLNKLFSLRGYTIDVSDQVVFTLKDPGLHDEEGNKSTEATHLHKTRCNQVVFFFHGNGAPIPGSSKIQSQLHNL